MNALQELVETFINGNITDAKKRAKGRSYMTVRDAFMDHAGYSFEKAARAADVLKGGGSFQKYCDTGPHGTTAYLISDGRMEAARSAISKAVKPRLEYLRGELRAERISYGELHELQSLAPYIEAGDVELLEAAGVTEEQARKEGRL